MKPFRSTLMAALVLAFSAPAATQPGQPAQTIEVYSYGFKPHPIHIAAGKPVTLTFTNTSGHGHDFTAKQFFAAATITAGSAPKGEIDLKGHETRSITLIPRAGSYSAHCSHFMHSTMGMTDVINVD